MLRLENYKEFDWIREELLRIDIGNGECFEFPNRYDHYCKILHPVYRDKSFKDESIFYSQCDFESITFDFGERLTFKSLAKKYNVNYTQEMSSFTLACALGGYPRYLILGEEGSTDKKTLRELVSILPPLTNQKQCYFYYDSLKIIHEFRDWEKLNKGLLYDGKLTDVLTLYDTGDQRGVGSPTYWWAEDKSWCIHTGYDSDYSIVGGNKALMDALFASEELECIEIKIGMAKELNELSLMKELMDSEINMLTELRMGNGLDFEKFEKCLQALDELSGRWTWEGTVPEEAVLTIIELYAELYLFTDNYKDKEKERIREAAEKIKFVREHFIPCEYLQELAQEELFQGLVNEMDEHNGFFIRLEQGKGIDEEQFEKIYMELKRVMGEINSWERIPLSMVALLISFYEMILLVNKYKYELNLPVEADKIYDAYERVYAQIAG